nr:hypothetical protein [Tanacetum cinerariifolium]
MSTQQDIYAAGLENRPPMLNKDNYVPWPSRIIRYARSRRNGKMIVDSIENGPYVRRMIATLREPDLPVLPEWKRHVTIVRQTKNLHNQEELAQPVMNIGQDRQIQNVEGNGGNQFGQYAGQAAQNQQGFNAWQNCGIQGAQNVARCYNCRGLGHIARNCTARPRRRDAAYLQTQLLIAQKEEAGIQLQTEEFDFMATAGDLDKIEEVNANCILMANLQQASTSDTQHDKAPVYDTDGLAENDNHVKSVSPTMVQHGDTVETIFAPNEETRDHQETVYRNLVDQVSRVNMINCNMRATNAELKSELAGYKNQEQRVEIKEHDPPVVYDSKETLELAQESREKMRFLKKEIKPTNYAKINHLSGVFVLQTTKSKEELFLSNVSNMVTVSKTISIPNEDLLDDTTPSVARKFLNENNWYTKCKECKYDKLSYDKAYNDMQQKVKRLQAQLRDLKGKTSDTPSASNTLDPLNQKLESKIVELEFQVVNYEREISHLKTTYKNLFDSIESNRVHAKLHDLIYEKARLRARVF